MPAPTTSTIRLSPADQLDNVEMWVRSALAAERQALSIGVTTPEDAVRVLVNLQRHMEKLQGEFEAVPADE